ncbi:MAG: hypothetical protein WA987_06235, partial [Cellvibrio sp.]
MPGTPSFAGSVPDDRARKSGGKTLNADEYSQIAGEQGTQIATRFANCNGSDAVLCRLPGDDAEEVEQD